MTWHVWTDGSCQHGVANVPKRTLGWGGWAAIAEHNSDGFVVHGRVARTTNVRMELRAAIEGLRLIPADAHAVLHTDCTTLLVVRSWWLERRLQTYRGSDAHLWRDFAAELERVRVDVDLIVRGTRDPIHRRAHTLAGAEARGGLRNMPVNVTPLDDAHRIRQGMKRRTARGAVAAMKVDGPSTIRDRLSHTPACDANVCASNCPIWFARSTAGLRTAR